MVSTTNPYSWNYNGSLAVGQTMYIYLTGHMSNNISCASSYTNNASVSYTINGNTQTEIAQPLNFSLGNTSSSTMSFEKRIVQYGNNSGDPVVFELLYQNN